MIILCIKVLYLNPKTFNTAPAFFCFSSNMPSKMITYQTITNRIYDGNVATKIAQFILLGVGG